MLNKVKILSARIVKHFLTTGHSKQIFILSHMRSRSSVLSHIFGSNDKICGYSELHNSYMDHTNIIKMKNDLYNDLKCNLRGKYLLDKILHNELKISKEIFETVAPKVVFLLREPENTLKSIINMGYITGIDWYKDPQKASEYYCSRLSKLAEYAETLDGNYYYLESDELVNNTDHILGELTKWLNLDTPLVPDYKKFNNTGKPGYGDPSGNILTGELIKTKGYPSLEIPPEILQIAKSSYMECKENIQIIK